MASPPAEPGVAALANRISRLADSEGRWSIDSDEVARLVGADPVTFWREVNGLRHRISFGEAIDGFTQDTVGDLVTVLERLVGDGAEETLHLAGIFLPHEHGVELVAQFLHAARRFSALHDIRTDDLAGMVRHARSVRGAIDLYLDEHADLEALIQECAEAYAGTEGLPLLAGSTAARYLRRMMARHVLEPRSLFTLLEGRLRTAAAGLGFVDPEDGESAAGASGRGARREAPTDRSASRRAWALRVMGFADGRGVPDPEGLRSRYRQLMMRHHPDVDPSGLERCKDVNVAYALLIAGATVEG